MSAPRILVADDNPPSLRFLVAASEAAGCAATPAADGTQALALAVASAFDLLLLDARMPGLGGAEVLARVRTGRGPSRRTTALATTAAGGSETRTILLAAGFVEVLHKPLTVAELQAALHRHLPRRVSSAHALDETQALAAAGGDAAIVAALRRLLAAELDALPAEIAAFAAARDADALRERLHRLDASAGFCGAPALAAAGARLRLALAAAPWPEDEVADFLHCCDRTRERLR